MFPPLESGATTSTISSSSLSSSLAEFDDCAGLREGEGGLDGGGETTGPHRRIEEGFSAGVRAGHIFSQLEWKGRDDTTYHLHNFSEVQKISSVE